MAVIGVVGVSSVVGHAVGTAVRPAPFLGIVKSPIDGPTRVGCFDALSLRPTSAHVEIGEYHDAWSASPDRTRVALGISAPGRERRVGLRIVNLARGAVELDIETGIAAEAVAWLSDRRLVAELQDGRIVLVDPVAGAVVRQWAGRAAPDAVTTRTRRRFVMIEPGRLAAVDDKGRLRRVSLPLPRRERGRRVRAALVADPSREHVYVLTGGRAAVDVDLRRMRARSRPLRPASERGAKPAAVRERKAIWLGGGLLAISGRDFPSGSRGGRTVPAGLSIVDAKNWSIRRVDSKAIGVAFAAGRLIAYGKRGVRAYALTGRRIFEALRGRTVWSVGTRGRLAYAGTPFATNVIDTGSGRVTRKIPRPRELSGVIARRCPTG